MKSRIVHFSSGMFTQSIRQEVTKSFAEELSLHYSNVLNYLALTADTVQIIDSLIFLSCESV